MKEYKILVSYEEQGSVTIKADSVKEAEELILKAMREHNLEYLDVRVTGREYSVHGEAKRL